MTFFANAHTDTEGSELLRQTALRAIETKAWEKYVPGDKVGLDEKSQVVPFHVEVVAPTQKAPSKGLKGKLRSVFGAPPPSAALEPIDGALIVQFGDSITPLEKKDCLHEFNLALGQWKLAYGVLCVQQDVAFQRVLDERARRTRIDAVGS
jgi:hypothetical protein